MLLVYMYDYNRNISILFLKKNQNYTKLIALHIATKLIKGDNTVTKRKVIQVQAELSTAQKVLLLFCHSSLLYGCLFVPCHWSICGP